MIHDEFTLVGTCFWSHASISVWASSAFFTASGSFSSYRTVHPCSTPGYTFTKCSICYHKRKLANENFSSYRWSGLTSSVHFDNQVLQLYKKSKPHNEAVFCVAKLFRNFETSTVCMRFLNLYPSARRCTSRSRIWVGKTYIISCFQNWDKLLNCITGSRKHCDWWL